MPLSSEDDLPSVPMLSQLPLAGQLDALSANVRDKTRVPLGVYRGLRFGMVLNPQWSPEVYLEGAMTRLDSLTRDHHGPRAVLNALDRLAGGYASEVARAQQDLAIAESQLRDYQARVNQPFTHEAYLVELTTLRDQLKGCLSHTAGAGDDGPNAAELAERIKVLKAAHTVEAMPQRASHKQVTAEEPVTARIRRHQERDGAIHDDMAAGSVDVEGSRNQDSPPRSFADRVSAKPEPDTLDLPPQARGHARRWGIRVATFAVVLLFFENLSEICLCSLKPVVTVIFVRVRFSADWATVGGYPRSFSFTFGTNQLHSLTGTMQAQRRLDGLRHHSSHATGRAA